MKNLTMVMALVLLGTVVCSSSLAQDRKVPAGKAAPTLPGPGRYSKEMPKTGLLATTSQVLVVTPSGAFGLHAQDDGHTLFAWADQGYDEALEPIEYQSGFLYFKVRRWQVIVAIRNEATGGKFDFWFFINGSTDPILFDRGPAYNVRQ